MSDARSRNEAALPYQGARGSSPLVKTLTTQGQVIYALILQDIKSRFFGNGLGYIVTVLWPCAHIVVIVGAYVLTGRAAPFGNSTFLYAITGVLPYIAWNYISRFMQLSTVMNKGFMAYPIIKFMDILIARAVLEINTVFIIVVICFLVLPLFGVDPMPIDPAGAAMAMLSAICLGVGFGIVASVITRIFPLFLIIYVVVLLGFWFTAGVAVNPEGLPKEVGDLLAWNPLLHSIEWLRKSFFIDAPTRLLDKAYVFEVAIISATIGLILERLLRPYFK